MTYWLLGAQREDVAAITIAAHEGAEGEEHYRRLAQRAQARWIAHPDSDERRYAYGTRLRDWGRYVGDPGAERLARALLAEGDWLPRALAAGAQPGAAMFAGDSAHNRALGAQQKE